MSDTRNDGDLASPPPAGLATEEGLPLFSPSAVALAAALETSSAIHVFVDGSWRVRFWNRQAERLYGIAREHALGCELWELLPGLRDCPFGAKLLEAQDCPLRIQARADHPPLIGAYSATATPTGEGFALSLHSLTPGDQALATARQELAEERARCDAAEEAFRQLADTMPHLAWMADGQGRPYWFNRRWLKYTGLSLAASQGSGWLAVHHPEHAERVLASLRRSWETGVEWEAVFPIRGSGGDYSWFLSRACPTRDLQGRVIRWTGTHTDVSSQVDIERKLVEANRDKNEFLATLAHELRNPLAPLRNGLQILMSEDREEFNRRQVQEMMGRQLKIVVRQVDELLDISRISLGRFQLDKGRHSVAQIINNAIETSLTLIDEKNHTLRAEVPPEPLYVEADMLRIGQVISNLLTNAAKYTPAGGHIQLTARAEGDAALITVRDNGIGLSSDQLAGIFNKFWRADEAPHHAHSGLGLGLSIARRLVEMHDGTIVASSPGLGLGSVFEVRLPRATEVPPSKGTNSSEPAAGSPPDSPQTRRVLVVDDNEDAAKTMAMMIRLHGSETHLAHDGREAVEKAEALHPDLILLDLGMPEMDGYEACQRIRKGPLGETVRIVALTGWAQEADKRRAKEAGFDRHLTKPVEPDEVLRLIQEL